MAKLTALKSTSHFPSSGKEYTPCDRNIKNATNVHILRNTILVLFIYNFFPFAFDTYLAGFSENDIHTLDRLEIRKLFFWCETVVDTTIIVCRSGNHC